MVGVGIRVHLSRHSRDDGIVMGQPWQPQASCIDRRWSESVTDVILCYDFERFFKDFPELDRFI